MRQDESDTGPASLVIERQRVAIELSSRGRLVPWLGPAFRGITLLRHRAASCLQPRDTWHSTWRHCRGCPLMPQCDYGTLFEPDAPAGVAGSRDAARPLLLVPDHPVSPRGEPGIRFGLDLVAIGPRAAAAIPAVIEALEIAGELDGLGPDRVRFEAEAIGLRERRLVLACDLPKAAAAEPMIHDVTIQLRGPLFLREKSQPGRRRQVENPGLGHLFRASMRVVREFFKDHATCPGRGHLDLADLAASIEPAAADLHRFSQDKASHRTSARFSLEGVTGSWTFAAVPACLLPWLQLGGLLHAGGHRIAGAGGWEMHFGSILPPRDRER